MYVFDDVNSVLSWPNNFLDVYVMMQKKKNEINVWLAGQSLLIPYALKWLYVQTQMSDLKKKFFVTLG